MRSEDLPRGLADDGIGMHRKDEVEIRKLVQEIADGVKDVSLGLSPVFPAVRCEQQQPAAVAAEDLAQAWIRRDGVPASDVQSAGSRTTAMSGLRIRSTANR